MPQDSHNHVTETPEGTHVTTRTETHVFVPNSSRRNAFRSDPSFTMLIGLVITGILMLGYIVGKAENGSNSIINNNTTINNQ